MVPMVDQYLCISSIYTHHLDDYDEDFIHVLIGL